jgi:putative membrane protein
MKKATTLFAQEEVKNIEATIGEIEKMTCAEMIPVVATASGRYDRSEDLFAFLLSLLVLGAAWVWFQEAAPTQALWSDGLVLKLNLPIVLMILVVSFFIGIAMASRFPQLRLPFISKREMCEEVERRARETFQRLKIRNTKNSSGVLLYVSLYEHIVHVVGDDNINAKLSQSDWQTLCDTIVSGFKKGKPDEGMRRGILRGGKLLAQHFPIKPNDKNELPNKLYLID